ncbi:MAG TPA: protein-methionine-sulfoxide reductase heme-binding subunit MsrQ [Alphaproteobacteria bacterium]|nr:protein-methionine-sulfoxide reductase heme-binding subunit MsrQ [Alphaproteobacteria bacterium]
MAKLPWLERNGRLSYLKLVVFIGLFIPGIVTAIELANGTLGARPFIESNHQTGIWAIRFLFLSLCITPFRRAFHWQRLILIRRMLGVTAFAYIITHVTLYVISEHFDLLKVASEIVLRFYLTIGFVAVLGLAALTATSTDKMMKRLGGKRWQRLHRLTYLIAILGTIHFFIQAKADVTQPIIMGGLFVWLMGFRLIQRRLKGKEIPIWGLAVLTLGSGAATALGEALYFKLKVGAPVAMVLATNFSFDLGVRPGTLVTLIGLGVTIVAAGRRYMYRARTMARQAT